MALKVEWNDEHSWKVTKKIVDGKVVAFKYMGQWYYPEEDYSGRDYMYGSWYIASDVCDNCALNDVCKGDNPIWNACQEANRLEINWHQYDKPPVYITLI